MTMLVLLLTLAAAPQSGDAPRVTVGVGGGVANPMHGDFDFVAPEWQLSLRGRMADGVTFEGFFNEWRHTEETFFSQRIVRTTRVVGVNVLAGRMGNRVGWSAGGGIGSMTFRREGVTRFTNGSFSVQALGGLDVRVAPRLLAFGQFQLVVPTSDPGSGHGSFTGGVRLVIR